MIFHVFVKTHRGAQGVVEKQYSDLLCSTGFTTGSDIWSSPGVSRNSENLMWRVGKQARHE